MKGGRPHVLMTADAVGGVWTYALDLGRGLVEAGVRVTLAVQGPAPDAAQVLTAARAGLELELLGGALDWTAENEAEVAAGAERLRDLSARLRPDVVQLNSPAFAAFDALHAPVVAACHSCVRTWWTGVKGSAPLPDDLAWRAALVARGYSAAAALLAPSHAFAEATQEAYGLAAPPQVIHNGRAPSALPERKSSAEVFTAGRLWDEGKDVMTLDRALGSAGLAGVAAGSLAGPNGQGVGFQHLQAPGRLSDTELENRLASRPLFVSPSLYEPFGLAVLEAAQAGCPLVLSDIATFRELWDGAATFFPPGDDAALARALQALSADGARREALGEAARTRAARYTLHAMTDATLRLYAGLAPAFARQEERAA